jgi:hypothetical protein
MSEGFADRGVPFEDRRMWRLLLARLHPDAGGDHELFLFAHALKEGGCGHGGLEITTAPDDKRQTRRSAKPFLRAWHNTMGGWASCNRKALKRLALNESPFPSVGD